MLLGHQAHVGKDTLAFELMERNGFTRLAFADKLKDVCMDLFGLSSSQVYSDLKNFPDPRFEVPIQNLSLEELGEFITDEYKPGDKIYYTPRQILQHFSQSAKLIDPNLWVNYICNRCTRYDRVVISDLRFNAEIDGIKKFFKSDPDTTIITVKITRNDIEDFSGKTHISETELSNFDWDYVITNNGSVEELYRKCEKILNGIV